MKSRAGTLLRSALDRGDLSLDDVARELSICPNECSRFAAGETKMSDLMQLCFAALLIERVPRLGRQAHALRSQAAAAMAYSAGTTHTHTSSPARWSDLKAR